MIAIMIKSDSIAKGNCAFALLARGQTVAPPPSANAVGMLKIAYVIK